MPGPDNAAEPSMEEILASIRKIIAEEPIGTRLAAPTSQTKAPNAGPERPEATVARSSAQGTGGSGGVSIDEVLDLADRRPAAGEPVPVSNGAAPQNGAASRRWSFANPFGGAQPSKPASTPAMAASNTSRNGARPDAAPFFPPLERTAGSAIGQEAEDSVSGQTAKSAAKPEEQVLPDTDPALVEAQEKVARHLGKPVVDAGRVAGLGLRSIRDKPPQEAARRPSAESLSARTAAAAALQSDANAADPFGPTSRTASARGPVASTATVERGAEAGNNAPEPAGSNGQAESKAAAGRAGAGGGSQRAAQSPETARSASAEPARALEAAIAEMLRPMLREWLDANLPRVVQQMLREEMSKAPLGGRDRDGPDT